MQPDWFPTPKRPVGIAALALTTVVAGVATVLRAVYEPFRTLFDGSVLGAALLAPAGIPVPPDGVLGGVLGSALIVAGIGLWSLRNWAWWLATIVGAVGLILSIGSLLWMIVFAAVLVYLVVVHDAFSRLRFTAQPSAL